MWSNKEGTEGLRNLKGVGTFNRKETWQNWQGARKGEIFLLRFGLFVLDGPHRILKKKKKFQKN